MKKYHFFHLIGTEDKVVLGTHYIQSQYKLLSKIIYNVSSQVKKDLCYKGTKDTLYSLACHCF